MRIAIWRKGNMFKFTKRSFSVNDALSRNYYPNPKIPIKPNTYYTFVVEYSNLSITAGQTTMGFGIGYGASTYSKDIVYRQEYPKETSGKVVRSFNTGNCGEGMNLQFRAIRQNSASTCSITWERAMVLEGAYTKETAPDFISYTDGKPLVETKINTLAIWSKITGNVLPEGYRELEYVESTGTQFINTNFKPDENSKMFLDFYPTIKQSKCFAGCRNGDSAEFFTINSGSANKLQYGALGDSKNVSLGEHTVGRHTVSIEKGVFTYDGVETPVSDSKIGTLEARYTVYLFACNTNGATLQSDCRIYSCKLWDNGTLVRDYVPCISPSGAVGMYDLVSNTFAKNSGSDSLIAGPACKIITKNIRIGGNA